MICEIGISASARAILDLPKTGFSGIKGLAAMLANGSTTTITDLRGAGARKEIFTALHASDNGHDYRERLGHFQFGMATPKLQFNQTVTVSAKCEQVGKIVGLPVILKQPKRLYVVNDQIRRFSALLASVTVALHSLTALRFPVWPPVLIVTAKPSRVVSAGIVKRSPAVLAIRAAKIAVMHRARNSLHFFVASGAMDNNPLTANALTVNLLPFGITRKTAKMVDRLAAHIRLRFILPVALVASECNHVCIIHEIRTFSNG